MAGILLRVSCIFVADGAKTGPKAEDLLEVEPLVCRVRVMVLRVVFCALVEDSSLSLQFKESLAVVACWFGVIYSLFAGVIAGKDVRFGGHQALPRNIGDIALNRVHKRGAPGVVTGVDIGTKGGEDGHHPAVVLLHERIHERGSPFIVAAVDIRPGI